MSRRSNRKPFHAAEAPPRSGSISSQTDRAARPEVQPPARWRSAIICVLLALAVWIVFGQTLHHEFINFDDQEYVYENDHIIEGVSLNGIIWAFTHSLGGNWHPLTTISHMLDCQFYGLHPGGHHLTNVLLHTATVLALFLVLRNMTGALWPSAFVAALFAIHPLRVESVAWVAERKDVLSGLFFMLTLGAYVRYVKKAEMLKSRNAGIAGRKPSSILHPLSSRDYWLAVLLFALGLMSKPMLVTLPFLLLLLDYWPLNRFQLAAPARDSSEFRFQLFKEKIPFVLLSAASCAATLLVQQDAMQMLHGLTLQTRVGNAAVAYVAYLIRMIFPAGLAVLYPHPANQLSFWTAGWSALVLMIISTGAVVAWRRRPYLLVGWLWYLGMLVPVIGFIQVGVQARADRYTYLPQIGLYVMLMWGAMALGSSWRYRRAALQTFAAIILTSLLVVAHIQTTHWKNSVSLWSHTLDCGYESAIAHTSVGQSLVDHGQPAEAIPHFVRALELKPDYADAYNNFGIALFNLGRLDEAIARYQRALQCKPGFAKAHNNLANALAMQGKNSEAVPHYERALAIKPDYAEAHNNLGVALANLGKPDEAMRQYERTLQLKPDNAEAHYGWGIALAKQGKVEGAVRHFQTALNLARSQSKPALVASIQAWISKCESSAAVPPPER